MAEKNQNQIQKKKMILKKILKQLNQKENEQEEYQMGRAKKNYKKKLND